MIQNPMSEGSLGILVATDFSPSAQAAMKQAIWLARLCPARIILMHVLRDSSRYIQSNSVLDVLMEQHGIDSHTRRACDAKMRQAIVDFQATDLDTSLATVLGEPIVELTHAVQAEDVQLVVAGTRGLAAWEQFFVGSTAKRLIRKCPAAVWIVKADHVGPPRSVLAATDFSESSRRAVLHGLWIAEKSGAEFHLLHVVDSGDVPDDAGLRVSDGGSVAQAIQQESERRFDEFAKALDTDPTRMKKHLVWGTPWHEIQRATKRLNVDLVALGTVGRSGIKGMLLGNTADRVLDTCDCSILTVKPEDFVSPIDPPLKWQYAKSASPDGDRP
jgi:universal stress protein E